MAPAEAHGAAGDLLHVVTLLGAAVVVVPVFKRLGLGSVLGYLAAGLLIGPFGLGLFSDPASILHVAELGVVMFLFVIGLEMEPRHLWSLRREIFGLGAIQVGVCGALLTGLGMLAGLAPAVAFIAAMGFVLSSTAIAMQVLEERGDVATPLGQRAVSILLFEDLCIVPLLALIPVLAPTGVAGEGGSRPLEVGIAVGAIAGLVIAGRFLLNPLFRFLAQARAREVMTAAALLVVLGAALLMQLGGLSMAMGAFLAGVLLSESSFRHELEADVDPFRGILLGLFFVGVGMSLDLALIAREWVWIVGGTVVYMGVKALGVYAVGRVLGADHPESLTRAALLAQGGEFAFVLYAAATGAGVLTGTDDATLTAVVILSMALTPIAVLALRYALPRAAQSMDGVEEASDLHGNVLIIGFGRFAQVASQSLLARGIDVAIIESDTAMIRAAAEFGFKVYYGDGTRLDVLRTSGAGSVQAILVCVEQRAVANRIVALVKSEFPLAKLYVRASDRQHAIELINAGVDEQVRETFDSALRFGAVVLEGLGVPSSEAAEIVDDVRRRDAQRLQLEIIGGMYAGKELLHGTGPKPEPLVPPKRAARALSEETADVITAADGAAAPAGS